eukprot:12562828-Alexandrium_andersonii.AAC.1
MVVTNVVPSVAPSIALRPEPLAHDGHAPRNDSAKAVFRLWLEHVGVHGKAQERGQNRRSPRGCASPAHAPDCAPLLAHGGLVHPEPDVDG